MRIVTLTTDFGDSAYTGALRGAVLAACPDARVVDVTHAVPAHDVVQGALALLAAAPCFPDGSVHVCVVDPGVGTARRGLLVECDRGTLVGPDNGVLLPAAERLGLRRVRALDRPEHWRATVSPVFHGRDVFGPVAGRLAAGVPPADVGSAIDDPVRLAFTRARGLGEGAWEARVVAVDAFGNVTTDLPAEEAPAPGTLVAVEAPHASGDVVVRRAYGEVAPGEDVLVVGSTGHLELAVNQGRAAQRWQLARGDAVRLTRRGS